MQFPRQHPAINLSRPRHRMRSHRRRSPPARPARKDRRPSITAVITTTRLPARTPPHRRPPAIRRRPAMRSTFLPEYISRSANKNPGVSAPGFSLFDLPVRHQAGHLRNGIAPVIGSLDFSRRLFFKEPLASLFQTKPELIAGGVTSMQEPPSSRCHLRNPARTQADLWLFPSGLHRIS